VNIMLKLIKKIVGFLSLILVAGGAIVLAWQYFRNKQMFAILAANSVVRGSLPIIQKMCLAVVASFAGLLVFALYRRLGGVVSRIEREKREAEWEAKMESEEQTRQLQKEAEDAKKELERTKRENELMKATFMPPKKEEAAEEEAASEEETQG
ncbi:MAG: hypothetical protein IKO38_00210, partial [Erysipelotrichaceae bacterium]|nr:hypothetical protein [Erysipelotrichaceae bacterium]